MAAPIDLKTAQTQWTEAVHAHTVVDGRPAPFTPAAAEALRARAADLYERLPASDRAAFAAYLQHSLSGTKLSSGTSPLEAAFRTGQAPGDPALQNARVTSTLGGETSVVPLTGANWFTLGAGWDADKVAAYLASVGNGDKNNADEAIVRLQGSETLALVYARHLGVRVAQGDSIKATGFEAQVVRVARDANPGDMVREKATFAAGLPLIAVPDWIDNRGETVRDLWDTLSEPAVVNTRVYGNLRQPYANVMDRIRRDIEDTLLKWSAAASQINPNTGG